MENAEILSKKFSEAVLIKERENLEKPFSVRMGKTSGRFNKSLSKKLFEQNKFFLKIFVDENKSMIMFMPLSEAERGKEDRNSLKLCPFFSVKKSNQEKNFSGFQFMTTYFVLANPWILSEKESVVLFPSEMDHPTLGKVFIATLQKEA